MDALKFEIIFSQLPDWFWCHLIASSVSSVLVYEAWLCSSLVSFSTFIFVWLSFTPHDVGWLGFAAEAEDVRAGGDPEFSKLSADEDGPALR